MGTAAPFCAIAASATKVEEQQRRPGRQARAPPLAALVLLLSLGLLLHTGITAAALSQPGPFPRGGEIRGGLNGDF